MRKSPIKKTPESRLANIDRQPEPALDLTTADPDLLRNTLREALSRLSEEERLEVYDLLLCALKKAGVNVGQHLLLLGIPARTVDELTAHEVATLIRYVRINEPRAMAESAAVLTGLLTVSERAKGLKVSRRAA